MAVFGGDSEALDPPACARGVIAVGFAGAAAGEAPLDALRDFAPGAIVLFGRNVGPAETLRALIAALRAGSAPPPLIAVDQEGGRVARIEDGVAALPPAMAVAATGDPGVAGELGTLVGRDLARLGVSVDFAPVVDLALHPQNRVIGTRSYGDDPEAVAAFAGAFARGLARGGVAPALKHFPGHGATDGDSHAMLPHITADAATLGRRDLAPFAALIAAKAAPMIMTTHCAIDAFDPLRPATLSPAVLTGLLREELGFEGAIVTDCLQMDAIAAGVGTVRGAVEALAAGADLLLISHSLPLAQAAADAIVAAVDAGEVPLARLHAAFARVRALRERYARLAPSAEPLDDAAPLSAARRAVTALRGDLRLRAATPVSVISFEGDGGDAAARSGGTAGAGDPTLSALLRRRGWKSEHLRVPLEPEATDVALLAELIADLGDREFVFVVRNAHLYPAQRGAVERLLAIAPNAVVVSAALPYDALLWPQARRVACIYGDRPPSFDACADVLAGSVEPHGRLPVRLGENAAVR